MQVRDHGEWEICGNHLNVAEALGSVRTGFKSPYMKHNHFYILRIVEGDDIQYRIFEACKANKLKVQTFSFLEHCIE
jgi:hypothetical protein